MEYSIKQVCVDDRSLREIRELLSLVFPKTDKFTFDYLRWQYKENPLGEIVGFNAYRGDELAAHYVAMPVEMCLFGVRRKGLLSLNTATHPEHQGKRLFSNLAERTYSLAREHGYEYIIGVANGNSTHGFLKNLGFYLVPPLMIKFGFGMNLFPDSLPRCYRIWDSKTLEWRLRNPATKYYFNQGIITSPKCFMGVKVIVGKTDLFQDISLKSYFRPVNLYVGLGSNPSKGIYFNVPGFIKHSPFNLIFKDLTNGSLPCLKKEDVFFQLLDFDVI